MQWLQEVLRAESLTVKEAAKRRSVEYRRGQGQAPPSRSENSKPTARCARGPVYDTAAQRPQASLQTPNRSA